MIPARGCCCTAVVVLPHGCLRHRGNCNASRMDVGLRVQNGYSAETAIKDSQGEMRGKLRKRIVDRRRSRIVSKKVESDGDLRLWLSEF